MNLFRNLALAVTMVCATASASAQSQGTVTLLVPYAAGASSDAIGRLYGQKLGEALGQTVIVDNRPGAGATIGTAVAARKGQQGMMALLADSAHTVAPALYSKLAYDPLSDFHIVGFVGQSTAVLYTHPQAGLKSVQDVLRRRDDKAAKPLTIGVGNGTTSHLIAALFESRAKVPTQLVPYKSTSPALADLAGGQIDLVFTSPASAAPFVSSGKLVPLAQTGLSRDPTLSKIPTFKEAGVDLQAGYWFAILIPSDTPDALKAKWQTAFAKVSKDPEVVSRLSAMGITSADPAGGASEFLRKEIDQWKRVSASANIRLN
jgi:tripartite-type tricarboxylate transporter receptor subunit TctC